MIIKLYPNPSIFSGLSEERKSIIASFSVVILISFLDWDAFKAFTFWSEHLILHTRGSLRLFLQQAGFKNISISGYQRYPIANHLHWLVKEKPGGHDIWNQLRSEELDNAYSAMLNKLDYTDTLIATATK